MSQIDHWARPRRPRKKRGELFGVGLVMLAAIGVWLLSGSNPGTPTSVRPPPEPTPSATVPALPVVAVAQLPAEAREVLERIDRGGPFRYDRDGSVFGNLERRLPQKPYGYYAEYTVQTPGSSDRGPRRIVTGDSAELYWTADHYESFSRIVR